VSEVGQTFRVLPNNPMDGYWKFKPGDTVCIVKNLPNRSSYVLERTTDGERATVSYKTVKVCLEVAS